MIELYIELKTVSEANCSQHWLAKFRRHRSQQRIVQLGMQSHTGKIPLPCTVRLTRMAPGTLDTDNLQSAFKWIRDEVSEILIPEKKKCFVTEEGRMRILKGRADDDPRITWVYDQKRSKIYAVLIEIILPEDEKS